MSTDSQALSDEIDSLLVRYLALLDEYTSFRGSLSSLQSSIYTNIARANFQAERGVRYGREAYDRKAITPARICTVTAAAEDGTVGFDIGKVPGAESAAREAASSGKVDENTNIIAPNSTEDIAEGMEKVNIGTEASQDTSSDHDEASPSQTTPPSQKKAQNPDPIRMFGFSIPSALRTAQSSSIQLVETSIPRLASISLQMQALEIQIRRARKYRAKALVVESGSVKGDVKEAVAV